eukprot:ctg_381.g133
MVWASRAVCPGSATPPTCTEAVREGSAASDIGARATTTIGGRARCHPRATRPSDAAAPTPATSSTRRARRPPAPATPSADRHHHWNGASVALGSTATASRDSGTGWQRRRGLPPAARRKTASPHRNCLEWSESEQCHLRTHPDGVAAPAGGTALAPVARCTRPAPVPVAPGDAGWTVGAASRCERTENDNRARESWSGIRGHDDQLHRFHSLSRFPLLLCPIFLPLFRCQRVRNVRPVVGAMRSVAAASLRLPAGPSPAGWCCGSCKRNGSGMESPVSNFRKNTTGTYSSSAFSAVKRVNGRWWCRRSLSRRVFAAPWCTCGTPAGFADDSTRSR